MGSFKFQDIRVEKANAISRYRRIQRITTLFRFAELFVFLMIIFRFTTRFVFSFNLSIEHFRGISLTSISPRFVFLLGNAIVIILFFMSWQFSANNGEKSTDFYEEYVEKCRKDQQACSKYEKKALHVHRYQTRSDERIKIRRSRSANYLIAQADKRLSELRRSSTERSHKSNVKLAVRSSYVEDEMSGEEFRRTVEAFIARRQKLLKEEEEFSATVF